MQPVDSPRAPQEDLFRHQLNNLLQKIQRKNNRARHGLVIHFCYGAAYCFRPYKIYRSNNRQALLFNNVD